MLAMIAILASLAAPSFTELVAKKRLENGQALLFEKLKISKMTARSGSTNVVVSFTAFNAARDNRSTISIDPDNDAETVAALPQDVQFTNDAEIVFTSRGTIAQPIENIEIEHTKKSLKRYISTTASGQIIRRPSNYTP